MEENRNGVGNIKPAKAERKASAKKFFIAALILLVVAGLCVALTFSLMRQEQYKNRLEGVYQSSYYDTMDALGNVETKLMKTSVAESATMKKTLLNDIWRECEAAQTNLSRLESTEGVGTVIKFLNQLGDYCYYLATKIETDGFGEQEMQKLKELSAIVTEIRTRFQEVQGGISQGGGFVVGDELVAVNGALEGVAHATIEYPELIYDGPFSDGLNDREAKSLAEQPWLTAEQARAVLTATFPDAEIISSAEGGGNIPTFQYEIKEHGRDAHVQLTKRGGEVLYYNAYEEVNEPILDEKQCVAAAEKFLEKIGYGALKAVWVSNLNSTVYVNFACVENDVTLYPDLVKVKLSAQSGRVVGVEAQNYIYNHVRREAFSPQNPNYEVSEGLTVIKENYALIPTEWNDEVLTREYVCENTEGETYYIYVNVNTGKEERILLVIEDNGTVLI